MSKFEFRTPPFNERTHSKNEDNAYQPSKVPDDNRTKTLLKVVKNKTLWLFIVPILLFGVLTSMLSFKYWVPQKTTAITFQWLDGSKSKKVMKSNVKTDMNSNEAIQSEFKPTFVSPGNSAKYQLDLVMKDENNFSASANIEIKNLSADSWTEILFYFLPNMAMEDSASSCQHPVTKAFYNICPEKNLGGRTTIQEVRINNEKRDYKLEADTLKVSPLHHVKPGESVTVEVDYTFVLPSKGNHFSKEGDNLYLGQWYPMLATYTKGWNKRPPVESMETHFTYHSDFEVNYQIPREYRLLSSADEDPLDGSEKGKLTGLKQKEMYLALMKNPIYEEAKINDVQIRVFGTDRDLEHIQIAKKTASEAILYFEEKVGDYPNKQLDIIIDTGVSKEYPGIIKVSRNELSQDEYDKEYFKHIIVQEIAHQYFYGVVNNDAYVDAWLDEGLSEFSTLLYHTQHEKKSYMDSMLLAIKNVPDKSIISNENERLPSNTDISKFVGSEKIWYLNGQPAHQLFQLLETIQADDEKGLQFLSEYYQNYAYQQVTTQEFIKFATHYFKTDPTAFSAWLQSEQN